MPGIRSFTYLHRLGVVAATMGLASVPHLLRLEAAQPVERWIQLCSAADYYGLFGKTQRLQNP